MSIKCQEQTIKTCTEHHGFFPYRYCNTVGEFSLPAAVPLLHPRTLDRFSLPDQYLGL